MSDANVVVLPTVPDAPTPPVAVPEGNPVDLGTFAAAAKAFWRNHVASDGRRLILVEAMSQDLRVTLRNLSVANALRRLEPARIVVYSGADEEWNRVAWSYFDLDTITELADSYGAVQVLDIHDIVDRRVAGLDPDTVVDGLDLGGDLPESAISPDVFDQIVTASFCRLAKVPRLDDSPEHAEQRAVTAARSREFARVYEALIAHHDVVALVSSHVDYNNFGLAVEAALRNGVPVLFPQSTGGLKAYALYPEHVVAGEPVRAALTRQIGVYFEENVWRHRDILRDSAELATYRIKATLGRPSWWRGGGSFSSVDLRVPDDRSTLRTVAASRVGLDPGKPVVTAFNHAVSDALGTNVESFADLATWYEATAEYAARHEQVGWLFLDHPKQDLYDSSGFFEGIAARYAGLPHMRFMPSMDLSKNLQVSLTDLVLSVRGSVTTEYPSIGIPALQCGWSEWSHCGFTTVVESPEEYVAQLDEHLAGLLAGRELITPEQVERARLWAWFYRTASDVPSGLVPPWRVGEGGRLFELLGLTMTEVEADADPAFVSMRRLWERRDPFLTRLDLTRDGADLVDALAPAVRSGVSA